MAKVLAVVASGMSVVSLAIQVAENLEKLKRFWELVEAAPEEVRLAIEEVEILSLVLGDIDRSVQQQLLLSPAIRVAVMKSLRLCRSCGDTLDALAKEMENSIIFSKRRGCLKVALKQEKMNIFKRKLENAKATFLLAHHCYSHAIQQQQWESHERDMAEMKVVLSGLQKPSSETTVPVRSEANLCQEGELDIEGFMDSRDANTDPPQLSVSSSHVVRLSGKCVVEEQSGFRSILGVIDLVREKRRDGTTTTSVYVDFPEWLFARRFEMRLRNSYRGWDQSFRCYRISDYDSDVFEYSMTGNIRGLQHLFDTGKASPFEVDPEGRSPLHYAAIFACAATCRFLLENGADANLRTSWEGYFDSGAGTTYGERIVAATRRSVSAWSLPISSYSTPLHLLASAANHYIEISKDARKGRERAQRLIGTDRSIEMEIQATAEALVLFGQTDLFHKDQLGNTVYHILDGSTTTWRWLRQQGDIQLANLKALETRDILLTRCIGLQDHDKNSLHGILPKGDKLRQLAGPASQSRLAEFMLSIICVSLTARALRDDKFLLIPGVQRHSIVPELVAAGSNIHDPYFVVFGKATLLTATLRTAIEEIAIGSNFFEISPKCNPPWMSRKGIPRCVRLGLLCPLEAAGVDLVAYGEEERAIHQRGQASWTIHITNEDMTYEILDIQPAALPQDFGIEWEDLYVSSALAEDFWRLVEGDDCFPVAMPGDWVD